MHSQSVSAPHLGAQPNSQKSFQLGSTRSPISQALAYAEIQLPAETLRTLKVKPQFIKACEVFCRIAQHAQPGIISFPVSAETFNKVKDTFRTFCAVMQLQAEGRTVNEIRTMHPTQGVRDWIRTGSLPLVLVRADPHNRLRRTESVQIPESPSPAFAKVLGALAASVERGEKRSKIVLYHSDLKVLQEICEALHESCGMHLQPKEVHLRGKTHFLVRFKSTLVPYFLDRSKQNSALIWEHLTTSAERQAFVRGFFAIANVHLHKEASTLTIARTKAPLLEGLAVILKREGMYPSLIESRGKTLLQLGNSQDLNRLVDLGALPLSERAHIKPGVRLEVSAELVLQIIELIENRVKAKNTLVSALAECKQVFNVDIAATTARGWRAGKRPPSVERYQAIEGIEKQISAHPEALEEVGRRIKVAVAASDFHPYEVVKLVAEFYGSTYALSRIAGLPHLTIRRAVDEQALPKIEEYMKILGTIGLAQSPECIAAATPPTAQLVRAQLKSTEDRGLFDTYTGSILNAARKAHENRGKVFAAVRDKINELRGRAQRMSK
jgi:hypothetical protein